MNAVLLDFNGTLFFDTCFHLEAWSRIYEEFYGDSEGMPEGGAICGPCNDDIIQAMAPELSSEERKKCSEHKEAIYRDICRANPDRVHLVPGAEELFQYLKENKIPFTIASASIIDNINFYFDTFHLERWFDREKIVYDDGSYANKGEMHIEAARRLGVDLSECIVVEDSVTAVLYSKKNGAGKIVAIGDESKYPELIRSGADYCICNFTEFDYSWL